jgi:hypothetical protein
MKRDMKRVGALTWTPVLLNGKTTRNAKTRAVKAAAPKKAAKRATRK